MFLSHLTAKPRDPKEIAESRPPRSEGNAIQLTDVGRAKMAKRHSSPETVPEAVPSAGNINDATMIGQLTVGTPPKFEPDEASAIERFEILRLNKNNRAVRKYKNIKTLGCS
jgi:hypothetical protein